MTDLHFNYFDAKHAIDAHTLIIHASGGFPGVKNRGLLESILDHVKNDTYYPELLDKMVQLVFGINKNHVFHDGNKRASIALSSYFLELNGFGYIVRQYTYGMEEIAVWLASGLIDKPHLEKIISFLLFDDEMHVAFFIKEVKKYRFQIERNIINSQLLLQMIDEWLSDNMELSENTKLTILDTIQ